MKKVLLFLFLMLGSLFLFSCKDKNNEPNVLRTVTEQEWNNTVKDFAFAKNPDSKLVIKVYSSVLDEMVLDNIINKDKLVFKFNTIVSETEFITYGDFANKKAYFYYGINRNHYYKTDYEDSIQEVFESLIDDFNVEYSKVKFENDEYISTIPYEGTVKYGHYKFSGGVLTEFSIYFDNELDYKVVIEPSNESVILPDVNYIDEMQPKEMKIYLQEALKELKSYGAIDEGYVVNDYAHYTVATFDYLRVKNDDETYKTLDQILGELKKLFIDRLFSNRVEVIEQLESVDEEMWFGMFKNGEQNGLIIKILPDSEKLSVAFAVVDYSILNIMALKEYLENRLVDNQEEDVFWFDSEFLLDTNDCFLISYDTYMSGEFEELVNYAKTCIEDNGYEWVESGSGNTYHYDIFAHDDKAVRVYFTSNGNVEDLYNIKVTFCVSFGDEDPDDIISYGPEMPLFR